MIRDKTEADARQRKQQKETAADEPELARDYTWVMARTPTIPQADYDALLARVQALGYPLDKIRKVPQQPDTTE